MLLQLNKFWYFAAAFCTFWWYHCFTITSIWNSRIYVFCIFFTPQAVRFHFIFYTFKLLLMISMQLITSLMPFFFAFSLIVLMFLLLINVLTSFGMFYSKTIKTSNIIFSTYKEIQWVPISEYSSRLITYAPSFILLGRLSREYTLINLGSFW